MNRLTITTLIIATGLGCQLANAAPPKDVPSVVVQFADLDLTHGNGAATLYGRLQAAAEQVCASQNGRNGSDIGTQTRYKICRQSAVATAVAKIDQPALTAYYRAQFPGRSAAVQIAKH
jgi:UrcA family protein